MESERLWVLSNLRAYCPPGNHEFLPGDSVGGSVRWCARCMKEEPADASGCMVCDLAGAFEASIRSAETGRRISGRLCRTCFAVFEGGQPLGGWQLEEARESAELRADDRR